MSGNKNMSHCAFLRVLNGSRETAKYEIGGNLSLGREQANDICLRDDGVSRRHAIILHTTDGDVLRDLKAVNGTHVNGQLVLERRLAHGDVIRVGSVELRYVAASTPEHDPSPAQKRQAAALEGMKALVAQAADPQSLFESILDYLSGLFATANMAILRCDGPDASFEIIAKRTSASGEELRLPIPLLRQVVEEGKTMFHHEAEDEDRFSAAQAIIVPFTASVYCAPLSKHGCVFYLDTRGSGKILSQEDSDLLEALTGLLADSDGM